MTYKKFVFKRCNLSKRWRLAVIISIVLVLLILTEFTSTRFSVSQKFI